MRKLLLLSVFLFAVGVNAQTDGLNYQAVIIDPNAQQLPGVNATGNILPNTRLSVRFTIFNAEGNTTYREVQQTATNKFGMIDLIIGQGDADTGSFDEIYWDGTPKSLLVEINLEGAYSELSRQELLFVPYAFHRNIKATGDLDVDRSVYFGQWMRVEGSTDLNNGLFVNNDSPTWLSGILTVEKQTIIGGNLKVTNESFTNLSGSLSVGDRTKLNSSLDVVGNTTLNNRLLVSGQKPAVLTGTLRVDGIANFNSNVNVNNGSPLAVSGALTVDSPTTLNDDLTVNGATNLNSSLDVNNGSPTNLTGTLEVGGQSLLEDEFLVTGTTNLNSILNVNNAASTNLSGTLTVDLATNLNSSLSVNNGAPTHLTGTLNVTGDIGFQNDLTVNGFTNLNNNVSVNNGASANLSGNLSVGGQTDLNSVLSVAGNTTMNNDLRVANAASTMFTGTLEVDGTTTLNNSLEVLNASPTNLNGALTVDGTTLFNNSMTVANSEISELSGTLDIDGKSLLNNDWQVTNGSNSVFSGILGVDGTTSLNGPLFVNLGADTNLSGTALVEGASTLNNILTVNGFTAMYGALDVTGAAQFNSLSSESITVQSNNPSFIAVFENTNSANGDGLQIKLARNHGAWNGGSYYNLPNVIANELSGPLAVLKGRLENPGPNPFFTYNEIIQLAPSTLKSGALINITNQVFNTVNTQLGLPIAFPDINMPGRLLSNEIEFFGGSNAQCSGQACFSICFPFAGCTTICIPPVNVCVPAIPRIAFPGINIPTIPLNVGIPNTFNFVPALPLLPENGISNVSLPIIPTSVVSNSLTKENAYITFADKDGRVAGSIRAQSLQDFRDNTLLDNVYVLNVLSSFVGIDLVDGVTAGITSVTNLVDEFNDLGVEYSSGNGDYAEWLERRNPEEYLSAGDIVAVKSGKISRDLSNAEQYMVVSRKPIVLGNVPKKEMTPLGNSVAFRGQVPVKITGPVASGDYIVADSQIPGYGKAVAPSQMSTEDFKRVVGRSWEDDPVQGPKIVKVVVGVQNGDWDNRVEELEKRQKELDATIDTLEEKLDRIQKKLTNTSNEKRYASYE
jgi:hypothetical protein